MKQAQGQLINLVVLHCGLVNAFREAFLASEPGTSRTPCLCGALLSLAKEDHSNQKATISIGCKEGASAQIGDS